MPVKIDLSDWYWAVMGIPDFVWSSDRLAYVPVSDSTYVLWATIDGNIATPIDSRNSLALVQQQVGIPPYLATGLTVHSTGNPDLNATYALDDVTLAQVGAVARDAASGLGLPNSLPTFDYPDITGFPHEFVASEIINLYKAMRDYVASVNKTVVDLVQGNSSSFPVQPAIIP